MYDFVFNYFYIDPRTRDWIIVNNFGLTMGVLFTYLMVVWLGPKVMSSLKPFELRRTIMVYNFLMVVGNGYVFYLVSLH